RAIALLLALTSFARAEGEGTPGITASDDEILGRPGRALRIQSIDTRISAFEQQGYGYQSQAGPLLGPGSEHLTVLEPQLEVVATQGPRITHRVYVPVDIVTAATPDATDKPRPPAAATASASRQTYAGTIDWTTTYKIDPDSDVSMRVGLHLEEPFRSWHAGMSGTHAFNEGDTVVAGTLLQV